VVPIEHDGGGLGEMLGLTSGGDDERLLVLDESMPCSREAVQCSPTVKKMKPSVSFVSDVPNGGGGFVSSAFSSFPSLPTPSLPS
jgi:hypothetical protein